MTEKQQAKKGFNWIPLIVVVSGICWLSFKETGFGTTPFFWFLCIPFMLFAVWAFARIFIAVMSRGRL